MSPPPLFKDVGGNHVGVMCPQDSIEAMNRSCVVSPFFLIHESAHMIPDAQDLFQSKLQILREQHYRFIAMTFEQGVGVVFPFRVVGGHMRIIDMQSRITILVNLTQVMEHPNDVR